MKPLTKEDERVEYNYLTKEEARMDNQAIDMQIALGLQSCKTKSDVCDLLEDVRLHERSKWLFALALAKKKITDQVYGEHCFNMRDLNGLIDKILDECFQIQDREAGA